MRHRAATGSKNHQGRGVDLDGITKASEFTDELCLRWLRALWLAARGRTLCSRLRCQVFRRLWWPIPGIQTGSKNRRGRGGLAFSPPFRTSSGAKSVHTSERTIPSGDSWAGNQRIRGWSKPPNSLATGGAGLNMSVTPGDAHAEIKGLDRESQTRRLQPRIGCPTKCFVISAGIEGFWEG
jgi:hypothetical protein